MVNSYHNMKLYHAETVLLSVFLGHHNALQMFSVNHSTVNLELAESIVDLCGRKLLSPSHHRMSEPETMTFIIVVAFMIMYVLGLGIKQVKL